MKNELTSSQKTKPVLTVVTLVPIADLLPLPELEECFPEKKAEEYEALRLDISERGEILEPLTVLGDGKTVYRGRSRLQIARELYEDGREEFAFLPCLIRPSKDPIHDAWAAVLTRRHWSGTQRAFASFNLYRDDILARAGRGAGRPEQFQNLELSVGRPNSQNLELSVGGGADNSKYLELSVDAIAKRTQTTDSYLLGFADLWREYKTRWDEVFKLVWYGGATGDGPVSLNRLRPALDGQEYREGGKEATKWYHATASGQLNLNLGVIPRSIKSLHGAFDAWAQKKLDLLEKAAFEKDWKALLAELPEELEKATFETLSAKQKGKKTGRPS